MTTTGIRVIFGAGNHFNKSRERMNTKSEQAKIKTRMVHIRLPEDLHKKLRICAAEDDMTIQDWVTNAIRVRLDGVNKINRF